MFNTDNVYLNRTKMYLTVFSEDRFAEKLEQDKTFPDTLASKLYLHHLPCCGPGNVCALGKIMQVSPPYTVAHIDTLFHFSTQHHARAYHTLSCYNL